MNGPRIVALMVLGALRAGLAHGQPVDRCRLLCAPTLTVEPTITITNLAKRPRIRDLENDKVERAARERAFEIILALDVPTTVPRLGFTFETIWKPGGDPVEAEFEMNLAWLEPEQTGGWLGSHFDVVDQLSPAERPGDRRAYTHKLNLELDTAVAPFNRLPEGRWLRGLELEASLDYVATGLPTAGDRVGRRLYLDDASRWSLSIVFVVPIAPL